MKTARAVAIWGGLALACGLPLVLAAQSPQLQWREPVYIVAGFAGILGMAILLVQPWLIAGWGPGLSAQHSRSLHRWGGVCLVAAVVVHVGALWITSPPDVVDALLFVSATQFSVWGVIAMWAVFLAAALALFRRRLRLRWRMWRAGHAALAVITVAGTVLHALLIDGTMETVSKWGLGALALAATATAVMRLRVWSGVFVRR